MDLINMYFCSFGQLSYLLFVLWIWKLSLIFKINNDSKTLPRAHWGEGGGLKGGCVATLRASHLEDTCPWVCHTLGGLCKRKKNTLLNHSSLEGSLDKCYFYFACEEIKA